MIDVRDDRGVPEAWTPDELVALALAVSEEGMRVGELPAGAVVVMSDGDWAGSPASIR